MLLTLIFSFSAIFNAKETLPSIEQGQTWYLESISNKLNPSTSKVLYYFSSDAYNTYQARIFSDWDRFSIIDSRNLVRLNKGDRIEILNSKHFEKIYEVKLLDGFEKNRKYYVIKDDLIRHYKLSKGEDS
ncbi:MAG: hypothetical protein EVA93_00890 [SAR86 cluster bacterium]|uniref:Uncharacterized protein n=1 Tax=SAR86 cluster bacterium TaxID=2030880 RepID=A0A520N4S0_9GAMM|nr:MAG: hypothetical protein EVA93_00890 [SAR86 cluster bacterium]